MTRIRPWTATLIGAAVLGMLAVLVLGAAWHLQGGRWFVTTSPSMGQELPVGSFLTTSPSTVSSTAVGDVVTFRSPSSGTVFTHRVVGKDAAGLETQGDVNGVPDAWRITDAELVGHVVWHTEGLGSALRALPLLLVGLALVWLLTHRAAPVRRRSWRLLGTSAVVAVVGWWLSPWVGLSRLGQQVAPEGEEGVFMDVVSTGLLPTRAAEVGGSAQAVLDNGQVGAMHLTAGADTGAFDVSAALHLSWWGWLVMGLVLLTPLLWSVATSLLDPVEPTPGVDDAARQEVGA